MRERNLFQRVSTRMILRRLQRGSVSELEPEDWVRLWEFEHSIGPRLVHAVWARLPHEPRCRRCGAPFGGLGGRVTRLLGYRPSRKNPHICATCVELSPPGGATLVTGVLFADIRGFTSTSEARSPEETAAELRRLYRCAEDSLFPEAVIDKFIGDEVMALYIDASLPARDVPTLMVEHARALLAAVGYGTTAGPFVEVGIGLDHGEAFVGNIGDRHVYDFTAVGDVVNTASRLQSVARGGEIVMSAAVADRVGVAGAESREVHLKGKREPQVVHVLGYDT